jgi:hypothetical protein
VLAKPGGPALVIHVGRFLIDHDRPGVLQGSTKLGMIDRGEGAARGEVRVVEIGFEAANRRPSESKGLARSNSSCAGKLGQPARSDRCRK